MPPRLQQPPNWTIAAKVHKLTWLLDRAADQILRRRLDFGYPQFGILMIIRLHPGLTQRTVASAHGLTEGAVSKRIEALCRQKLIIRRENPRSRREHLLALTPAGERLVQRAITLLDRELVKVFARIKPNDRRQLGRALDVFLEALVTEAKRVLPTDLARQHLTEHLTTN